MSKPNNGKNLLGAIGVILNYRNHVTEKRKPPWMVNHNIYPPKPIIIPHTSGELLKSIAASLICRQRVNEKCAKTCKRFKSRNIEFVVIDHKCGWTLEDFNGGESKRIK